MEKLIKGNKKDKPITDPWVVASLPETQSFIKLIKIKNTPEELTEDDIKELAKKHIPYDDDGSYYIEWQIMPSDKDVTRILIGTIQKSIADSYTYLLESLGLGVIALEIEALAITRTMVTASKEYENEARALLDLGAARSSLIIYDKDIIQFSISLPFSGEIITTALAQKLHISAEEAETIKIKQGLNYRNKDSKAWEVLHKVTSDLIKYIKDAIDFYYSHFPEANKVTRITMCGGGSNMNKLDKILSSKLKVIAKPGHPWKNLSSDKILGVSEEESLSYATAIGLALRAADNPFFTHDAI
jgi:type IV pilus assembly protein PilM